MRQRLQNAQVCGARGAGGAAAQGVFLAMEAQEVYMLVALLSTSPPMSGPLLVPVLVVHPSKQFVDIH